MALRNKLSFKGMFAGYGRMVRHALRYNWILGLISFIAFVCLFPVRLILEISNTRDVSRYEDILKDFFNPNSGVVFGITISLAFVFSVVMFRYLHGKKSINFYHSLPVKREAHFLASLTVSVIYFTVAFLVCLAVSVVIYPEYMGTYFVELAVKSFFLNTAYFIMLSAFFSVSAVLCGTVWSHTILAGISLVLMPWVYTLTLFFALSGQSSLYTGTLISDSVMGWQSPLMFYFTYVYNTSNMNVGEFILAVVGMIAAVALLAAIALLIYRKAKSENAGKPIIFGKFSVVLKYILTYAIMLSAGYIISEIFYENFISVIIAAIAVGFVTFGIINMIFHQNRKKFFAGAGRVWIMLAAFLVIYPLCYFDVAGLDKMLPEAENVESITIYYTGDAVHINNDDDIKTIMDNMYIDDDIKSESYIAVEYVNEPVKVEYTNEYEKKYGVETAEDIVMNCRASMKLKSGIIISKYVKFKVSTEPSAGGIPAILSGKNTLETTINYLFDNKDKLDVHNAIVSTACVNSEYLKDFGYIDCLKKDLANIGEDYYKQTPVAIISFYGSIGNYNSNGGRYVIYITEDMTNTIEYLKEIIPDITLSWEEKAEYFEYCNVSASYGFIQITDKAQIAELLKHAVDYDCGIYDRIYCSSKYDLIFKYKENHNQLTYNLYRGEFPEYIENAIEATITP